MRWTLFSFLAPVVLAACGSSTETDPTGSGGAGGDGGGSSTQTASGGGGAGGKLDNGKPSNKYPAPHDVPPRVVNLGGPVLESPTLIPVFFANDDDTDFIDSMIEFVDSIGPSDYWAAVTSEFGVGPASMGTPIHLEEDAPSSITDDDLQDWLTAKITAGAPFPVVDDNTMFVLYYPEGTKITLGGQGSCQDFGGYHNNTKFESQFVAYAVIPRCNGFGGSKVPVATTTSAHEFIEAATDPYPTSDPAYLTTDTNHIPWIFAIGGGELADLCQSFHHPILGDLDFPVVRSWSNKAAFEGHDPCVPAPIGEVYYNAAPHLPDVVTFFYSGQQLTLPGVKLAAGESKTIDIDLFSDAQMPGPWTVSASTLNPWNPFQGSGSNLVLTLDRETGVNGEKLHLTIERISATVQPDLFYMTSTSGEGSHNYWVGIVGN